MANALTSAPLLSTPDNHILGDIDPTLIVEPSHRLSDEQICVRYEVHRTIKEIKDHRWRRVGLQFPDHMLPDSARVYQMLSRGLKPNHPRKPSSPSTEPHLENQIKSLHLSEEEKPVKLTILGDTSYGSCCVDEIAAEHVDAEAVIHYGRSCLSPTARLPVIHIFTCMELEHSLVVQAFEKAFAERTIPVILTADTPYTDHVEPVTEKLRNRGYTNIFASSMVHDPSSLIPNRTVPEVLREDNTRLNEFHLFHISEPPTSLLLTLSSGLGGIHIYPTQGASSFGSEQANTSLLLRRRYALITSLSTISTWGILINTLSVKNYLHIVEHVKSRIAQAGKKSYTFVVGKLNAAKVANFAEIEGWVVVGCWESSLVDSKDFYKPLITPYELDLVLAGDQNRVWTGAWRSDFQGLLNDSRSSTRHNEHGENNGVDGGALEDHDYDSEEESAPPEFDLRTGKYVSHTRPMITSRRQVAEDSRIDGNLSSSTVTALTKRPMGEILDIKGVASPAAKFLTEKRTWKGLGSDFEIRYDDEAVEGDLVEEGRTGVARGYTIGESART